MKESGAYQLRVCNDAPSVALSLLDLWDRPWSGQAMRFAAHRLRVALARGLDVLDVLLPAIPCPICDCVEAGNTCCG